MFKYYRIIVAISVIFCLTAVVAVTTANTAYNTPSIEGSRSPFFPPPNQFNQNSDNQSLESSSFIDLHPSIEIPIPHLFMGDFSFDLYGERIIYLPEDTSFPEEYNYNGSITVCGNCGPVPPGSFVDPLREDQYMPAPLEPLTGQSPFIEEAWQADPFSNRIICGDCGGDLHPYGEFL